MTISNSQSPVPARRQDQTHNYHKPRILCLHGGGTNARIFRMQCRSLIAQLSPYFRLVFAEAPFPSTAGPDVLSVYRDFGPFKRWLAWLPEHDVISLKDELEAIEECLERAMLEDEGTGEWVALLGFSQGARVAGSLLLRQQLKGTSKSVGEDRLKANWRFGVLMGGRGPLVVFERDEETEKEVGQKFILEIPTIHVHGLNDPGLEFHRALFWDECGDTNARLVEWDGDHRLPIKTHDVAAVVNPILTMAKQTRVLLD